MRIFLCFVLMVAFMAAGNAAKATSDSAVAAMGAEGSLERNLFSVDHDHVSIGSTIGGKLNDISRADMKNGDKGDGVDYGFGVSFKAWDNVRLTTTFVSATGLAHTGYAPPVTNGNPDDPIPTGNPVFSRERDYRLRGTVVIGF